MKSIALMTRDFTLYHDVIKALRARDLPFVSLDVGEDVPASVGVIITGERDEEPAGHPTVVVSPYPRDATGRIPEVESAIDAAIAHLRGGIDLIVIGLDPGKYPGVAVLADGYLLNTYHLTGTATIRSIVREIRRYHKGAVVARIGNGSPRERDRTIEILLDEGVEVQVVNERGTTKNGKDPDVRAAIHIARYCPVIEVIRPARRRITAGIRRSSTHR